MNLIHYMTPVPTLDFTAQAGTLFIQKDVGDHDERPKAQDGGGTHQLIRVETQQVFCIAKQDLDIPARRNMVEQGRPIRVQVTGGPIWQCPARVPGSHHHSQ
jgi:hypothetical protein